MSEPTEPKRICSNCGFDAKDPAPFCPVCGSDFLPPQNTLAPCPQELPAVGGRRIDCSNATFERRALIALANEQAKLSPDNSLIALYCDAVRLTREYSDAMNASLAPCPIKDEGEETDTDHVSALLSGEVKGTWHVHNRFGDWNVIYDDNELIVGHAYWKDDRDAIVAAHNRTLAGQHQDLPPLGNPEASPATTGKGPMEALFSDFYDAWCDHADSSVKLRTSRTLETLANKIALLRGAPSEGRGTDEQGGLPVTPNSSVLDWMHNEALEQRATCPCGGCTEFRNSSSPALPLPLSEETKKDL